MKCECGCITFTAPEEHGGPFVCTNCNSLYDDASNSGDDDIYDGPRCSCRNSHFYARQICYYNVVANGNNVFEREVACADAENPYGPYTCTLCGKEYDDLEELTNNEGT